MAAETQYTANTGMVTISTANANLDGTGTLGTVITGAAHGTLVKTVTIKAQTNTTQGMVRLFIFDGILTSLITEIAIPSVTKSATDSAFEITVPIYLNIASGYLLKASTQNAETFNVIAEGQDYTYYAASVRPETTLYVGADITSATVSTANSNLDGTGTLGTVIASAAVGQNGIMIWAITIKAKVSTTQGMIRLFLYDGTNTKLLKEVPVDAVTQSGTNPTFYHKIKFENGFALKGNWTLKASTEKGEAINIIPETGTWLYPA